MTRAVVLVGNPQPNSRTRAIAEEIGRRLGLSIDVIELADHGHLLFDYENSVISGLKTQVLEADVLIVATPTYKATYTGLLKAFLDRFNAGELSAKVTVPIMTGGDRTHSLAVQTSLAPLLSELGSSMPAPGLYVPMSEFDELDKKLTDWVAGSAGPIEKLLS